MAVRVYVYENGLIRAMKTDGNHWNKRVATEVMMEAEILCPVGNTGALASSHGTEQERINGRFSTGWTVYNDHRTAAWVHNGTGLYGPARTEIVPKFTPKRMFLHMPPGMGFRWKLTSRDGMPVYDLDDPFGHLKSHAGMRGRPWLLKAGLQVTRRHG